MSVHLNHSWPAIRGGHFIQEAVMGQAIPRQHPAVVLRSHYRQLKALLAITMIAVVGLSLAVTILATNDESSTGTTAVKPISGEINYGGFNPATGRPVSSQPVERTSVQSIRPEETGVAAAIAQTPEVARPDESKVAASIARAQQAQTPSVHDESSVAAAISGD
jgi:hypothetical protein